LILHPEPYQVDLRAQYNDPYLNRFQQPDTVIPGAANPQAFNRYSYTLNQPISLIDPSGHMSCNVTVNGSEPISEEDCYDSAGGADGAVGYGYDITSSILILPLVPPIPPSPEGGDSATPWDVGVEWLTGEGPRNHEFREGDNFTELLQTHDHIEDVRLSIAGRLKVRNYRRGEEDYYLGGIQGVPKYFVDYSTLLTGGTTGNLAVTYLGSYDLDYFIVGVDSYAGTAEVRFHVFNESILSSATHPPLIGYTNWYLETVSPFIDGLVQTGPMSRVTQNFWWDEIIDYK
jgi:RHS repeat-associated protein